MTIYKTTAECEHSWCQANFKVANADGKYPAICRKCGAYTLLASPTQEGVDAAEYERIENLFNKEDRISEKNPT